MIKKIPIQQLRKGMYVHELLCNKKGKYVLHHHSLISSEKTIELIHSWNVQELLIDTDKGLDVIGSHAGPTSNEASSPFSQSDGYIPRAPLKQEAETARKLKITAVKLLSSAMKSTQRGNRLHLEKAFDIVRKMEESVSRNRDALLLISRIRQKDEYTLLHSIGVSSLTLSFCNSIGLPYDTTINLGMGALLHDIGKTSIPLVILNKPGKLTSKEYEIIKTHAQNSVDLLLNTSSLPAEVKDIALHHHERYDGSGYPQGLQGKQISLGARLVSICDVYDAITSDRCYKAGINRVEGLSKLYQWSNHFFDKELTYKFIRFIGVYPIGTCVKIENGLIGIVSEATSDILKPVVRVFCDVEQNKAVEVKEINLLKEGLSISNYESSSNWNNETITLFKRLRKILNPLH